MINSLYRYVGSRSSRADNSFEPNQISLSHLRRQTECSRAFEKPTGDVRGLTATRLTDVVSWFGCTQATQTSRSFQKWAGSSGSSGGVVVSSVSPRQRGTCPKCLQTLCICVCSWFDFEHASCCCMLVYLLMDFPLELVVVHAFLGKQELTANSIPSDISKRVFHFKGFERWISAASLVVPR